MESLAQAPISNLKGIGPKKLAVLERLNIRTIFDLLLHLPSRYENRTTLTPISHLQPDTQAVVKGRIISTKAIKKRQASCLLKDETGILRLHFFNVSPKYFRLTPSSEVLVHCYGKVYARQQQLVMLHPEYWTSPCQDENSLTPIYPTTRSLSQKTLRQFIRTALQYLKNHPFPDFPPELLKKYRLLSLVHALYQVHHPSADTSLELLNTWRHPAQKRLILEEWITHRLAIQDIRLQLKDCQAPQFPQTNSPDSLLSRLHQTLPFSLTTTQENAMTQILEDLSQPNPMLRLLQGDVGSGKTVVAACAMAHVVSQGHQAILMAPTEVLASQHTQTFTHWFKPLNVSVGYLSGQLKTSLRTQTLKKISSGDYHILIGTHALLQSEVLFKKVGLLVADEQHRFGVHQRLLFQKKAFNANSFYPHQLMMSATPIPRTLAMTLYADVAVSTLTELPQKKVSIRTVLVNQNRRQEVMEKIFSSCQKGHQAYWICPFINESDDRRSGAIHAYHEFQQRFPLLKIGLLHGQLSKEAQMQALQAFQQGETALMVATTIVEVGLDVPNATIIVIEHAGKLGLCQLHQLRGRVGRGQLPGFCILLYTTPLSTFAQMRLAMLRTTQDGFSLAEQDLLLRGPGEMFGSAQKGYYNLKICDFSRDRELLDQVAEIATVIAQQHRDIIPHLLIRWIPKSQQENNKGYPFII